MKTKNRRIIISVLLIVLFIYAVTQIGHDCFLFPKHSKTNIEKAAPSTSLEQWTAQTRAEISSDKRMADAISADAAIVVDPIHRKTLFEKNADRKEYPASMTKMMTCILAIESGRLDSVVPVSQQASDASDTYLSKGDRLVMSNLLYMLMLSSNNGAAVALSEYLSTRGDSFINKMNRKAKMLGMNHTHFVTPNGMHAPNHYSTARDMALLANYCMRNAKFREFVKTKEKRVRWQFHAGKNIHCRNENKLLDLYDGVNGVKTGYTDIALGCLATSYEKNGKRLIVVVMHSSRGQFRFHDTVRLLDWAKKRC